MVTVPQLPQKEYDRHLLYCTRGRHLAIELAENSGRGDRENTKRVNMSEWSSSQCDKSDVWSKSNNLNPREHCKPHRASGYKSSHLTKQLS